MALTVSKLCISFRLMWPCRNSCSLSNPQAKRFFYRLMGGGSITNSL